MSAGYMTGAAFALPSEEAVDPFHDEELAKAAVRLLAGGPVEFKLSTRVSELELPLAKRRLIMVLRCLPAWLYVPPALAVQRGVYDDWSLLLHDCTSPDDQILALPKNRALGRDAEDVAVECRPLDKTDEIRFLTLDSVFRGQRAAVVCTDPNRNYLRKCLENLPALVSRVSALEARVHALEEEGADASEIT